MARNRWGEMTLSIRAPRTEPMIMAAEIGTQYCFRMGSGSIRHMKSPPKMLTNAARITVSLAGMTSEDSATMTVLVPVPAVPLRKNASRPMIGIKR